MEKLKLRQLKFRCECLGIPKYGSKADLIRRIEEKENLNNLIQAGLFFRQMNHQKNLQSKMLRQSLYKCFVLALLLLTALCVILMLKRNKAD